MNLKERLQKIKVNKKILCIALAAYTALSTAPDIILACYIARSITTGNNSSYKIEPSALSSLTSIAGLYARTVKLEKTNYGYELNGDYNYDKNPEALQMAMKNSDLNKDNKITRKEADDLVIKVIKHFYHDEINVE